MDRLEWRGDVFRSDLGGVLPRLPSGAVIERSLRDTVTVFYSHPDGWVEERRPLRLRLYADLPELSPSTLTGFIHQRMTGKVQVKTEESHDVADEVHVAEIGDGGTFPSLPEELNVGRAVYTPHSVRVARRVHYSAASLLDRAAEDTEAHRVTLDLERHLFRLAGRSRPTYLGDLGPRLEIKAADPAEVEQLQTALGVGGLTRTLRYRSLELLFQDLLLDELTVPRSSGFPEIEGKLEVVDPATAEPIAERLVDVVSRLEACRLLLPFPHRIVRLRRYHVCERAGDEREWTVVETMAGRLSTKVKARSRREGGTLIRDTEASHVTDRDGATMPVDQFLAERGLVRLNVFEKLQTQVAVAVGDGYSFIVKIDDCSDPEGRRHVQCEVEAIGRRGGELEEAMVRAHTERLVGELLAGPLGSGLRETHASKHALYSSSAKRGAAPKLAAAPA